MAGKSLLSRGLQRRSRMHRFATGKTLALTPRDIEIFRQLSRYRYLRSTYLHAFVGGKSKTRFKERLGDLFHEGYIDRPDQQWTFADARHQPAVYEIGTGARRVLADLGHAPEAVTFLGTTAHRQFQHAVLICACLASLDLATRNGTGARFIGWPEILARAPQATQACAAPFKLAVTPDRSLIPDGLFGLEYASEGKKSYRFFALEIDRGTMPVSRSDARQTSYMAKLDAYRSILSARRHHVHWGVSTLLVLTLTSSAARAHEIARFAQDRWGVVPNFLFKALPDTRAPDHDLLQTPWWRAGAEPLGISSDEKATLPMAGPSVPNSELLRKV